MPATIAIDNDALVLEDAAAAASNLDVRYKIALELGLPETSELRDMAAKAMEQYGLARLKFIQAGTLASDVQVVEIRRIRAQIDKAASNQAALVGAVQLVGFLMKFV